METPKLVFRKSANTLTPYSGLQNFGGTGSYTLLVIVFTALTVSVSVTHFDVKKVSGYFPTMKVCEELITLLIILLYN
jgi:hypothetical protein